MRFSRPFQGRDGEGLSGLASVCGLDPTLTLPCCTQGREMLRALSLSNWEGNCGRDQSAGGHLNVSAYWLRK